MGGGIRQTVGYKLCHLQGWVMDEIFEVDSAAVLSKVSEAAVTHCREERDG